MINEEELQKTLESFFKLYQKEKGLVRNYLDKIQRSLYEIEDRKRRKLITDNQAAIFIQFAFNNFKTTLLLREDLQEIRVQKIVTAFISFIDSEIKKKL